MNIDELLTEGNRSAHLAIRAADNGALLSAGRHAAIAQACASLAQAMIMAQVTETIKRPGLSDRCILSVDTGN